MQYKDQHLIHLGRRKTWESSVESNLQPQSHAPAQPKERHLARFAPRKTRQSKYSTQPQSQSYNLNLKVMTFLFSLTFLQKFSFILLWPKEAFVDHPVIPLNIPVFIWSLLYYIIPVDKTMQRTCITLVSTCSCINNYLRSVFCKAKSHIALVPK